MRAHIPRKKIETPGTSAEDSSPQHYNCTVGLPKALEKHHKNWAAHSFITQQEMKIKKIR